MEAVLTKYANVLKKLIYQKKIGMEYKTKGIYVAKTVEDVLQLKDEWKKLQKHPNSDFYQYLWSITELNSQAWPYVLYSIDKGGHVESILIGRRESERLDIRLGYFSLYRPKINKLTFIYEGLLGKESKELSERYVHKICEGLKNKVADIAWFNHLKKDSSLLNYEIKLPNRFTREIDLPLTKHWAMTLPLTTNDFWKRMSAKHRYWLKRLPKYLEKCHPGKVSYEAYRHISQIDELCNAAEFVSRKTYQRALGVGYRNSKPIRSRMRRYAERGHLRAYVCFVEREPIAFWIGFIYEKIFHLAYTGYDPKWRKYEVGTILFIRMIEDLIQHDRAVVEQIDFGLGDAEYKKRFGDTSWEETSLFIYSSTWKSKKIKFLRDTSNKARRCFEMLLKKCDLEQKIKTLWRRRKTLVLRD